LDFLLQVTGFIFGNFAGFLQFFDAIDALAALVSDRYPALLRQLVGGFDKFLPPFSGEGGNIQANTRPSLLG
jgi:hypothetical protein